MHFRLRQKSRRSSSNRTYVLMNAVVSWPNVRHAFLPRDFLQMKDNSYYFDSAVPAAFVGRTFSASACSLRKSPLLETVAFSLCDKRRTVDKLINGQWRTDREDVYTVVCISCSFKISEHRGRARELRNKGHVESDRKLGEIKRDLRYTSNFVSNWINLSTRLDVSKTSDLAVNPEFGGKGEETEGRTMQTSDPDNDKLYEGCSLNW